MLRALVALAILLPYPALAQPFGIAMGTPIARLIVIKKTAPGIYLVTPPKTHPEFPEIVVKATAAHGVCAVKAIGKSHDNDAYGTGVRDAFSEVRTEVDQTYGHSTMTDFLRPDAIWKEPDEWVMSIMQHARYYMSTWGGSKRTKVLPNDVDGILLQVSAESSNASLLILQFEFDNMSLCD